MNRSIGLGSERIVPTEIHTRPGHLRGVYTVFDLGNRLIRFTLLDFHVITPQVTYTVIERYPDWKGHKQATCMLKTYVFRERIRIRN